MPGCLPDIRTILLAAILTLGATSIAAHNDDSAVLDEAAALEISQAAVGGMIGDYRLRDSRGKSLNLDSLRGQPLIISMVYTSCAHICPMLTQTLSEVVDVAREALGSDSFTVLSIGFDTRVDTPERMRLFGRDQGVGDDNWLLLSADHATIEALSADLGFLYVSSAKGFDHLMQTTIIDGEGRVVRQVYGQNFAPPPLVEPLKALVFGADPSLASVDGWLDRVRLFCTIYDPASERYRFDYSLFIGMAIGFVSLVLVGTVLLRGWIRQRRLGRLGRLRPTPG
jgi:protein SCO1